MAAITTSNLRHGLTTDGTRRSVTITLGAGSTGDTVALHAKLGLRRIDRVWLDVTAAFGTAPIQSTSATTTANTVAGTYRFEGK